MIHDNRRNRNGKMRPPAGAARLERGAGAGYNGENERRKNEEGTKKEGDLA